MQKVVLFAFNGDPGCFAHVMLNAIDMKDRGFDVTVVIEGDATKLVSLLRNETKPYADLFRKFKNEGLVCCVCKACATKNSVIPAVIEQGFQVADELSGHPSIGRYIQDGYQVIVF